jgi:hypothetical protein
VFMYGFVMSGCSDNCVGVLVIRVLVFTVFLWSLYNTFSFMLLFNIVSYVLLLLCLYILIVMYVCSILHILFSSSQLALFGYTD